MTRPMSRDDTRRLSVHLHGRRFALFVMAENWVRHLEVHLSIAWDQVRQNLIENMALLEMQRRESQLPVRCLCEETYVLECIWRIVSNDEAQQARADRHAQLQAQVLELEAKLAQHQVAHPWHTPGPEHIEAQLKLQDHLEAQLAQLARRGEDPSPLQAEP